MKEFLFILGDGTTIFDIKAETLKKAIFELSKKTGNNSELFFKALNGFDKNDIDGLVEIYNHFVYFNRIEKVYEIEKVIYDVYEVEE